MDRDNEKVLYNVLFPIWLLVFFPSYLWLILIPANYLIDRIVLRWSLGDMPDKGMFCRKNTWKICLAGFLSDFIGAIALFFISELLLGFSGDGTTCIEKAGAGLTVYPSTNVLSFLIIAAGIALSAVCIYKLDKRILGKTELEPEQAKRAAFRLALFTAPYLYLIPSRWFY